MKTFLTLLSFAALASSPAIAMPFPNLDQIDTLKCTVTAVKVRNSFIPPKIGDTLIYATFQDTISELQFERDGAGEVKPYVALPMSLERVDRDGFRHENLRTFVGIRESFANLYRQEATMKVEGTGTKFTLSYSVRGRSLPDGQFKNGESMSMDCVINSLN